MSDLIGRTLPTGTVGQTVRHDGTKFAAVDTNVVNVQDPPYNATGDGVTDDTAAITAALAAAGTDDAIIYFPPGVYLDTAARDFSESSGLTIMGAGSLPTALEMLNFGGHLATEWRYTGTAARFIDARESNRLRIEGIAITYSSASFTGDLIDLSISRFVTARDFYFGGSPSAALAVNARTAMLLAGVAWADFESGGFARVVNGVWGTDSAVTGGHYSNAVTMTAVTFSTVTNSIRNPNTQWTLTGAVFEGTGSSIASSMIAPIVVDADAEIVNLNLFGCGIWDNSAVGGGPFVQAAGLVKGLTIAGCLIGARADDGPFLDLTSPSYGIVFVGNYGGIAGAALAPLVRVSGGDGLKQCLGRVIAGNRMVGYYDNGDNVGPEQVYQPDAAYTLKATDAGKVVNNAGGAPTTVTIPPVSSVEWAHGTTIRIVAQSQAVTVAAGVGVTLRDPRTLATIPAYGSAVLVNVLGTGMYGSDNWHLTP